MTTHDRRRESASATASRSPPGKLVLDRKFTVSRDGSASTIASPRYGERLGVHNHGPSEA
jgi:hypothetical protein